jgi:hypothetical protein
MTGDHTVKKIKVKTKTKTQIKMWPSISTLFILRKEDWNITKSKYPLPAKRYKEERLGSATNGFNDKRAWGFL